MYSVASFDPDTARNCTASRFSRGSVSFLLMSINAFTLPRVNSAESTARLISNVFSWWDRLFGTYVDQPAAGHDGIVFGVTELSERKHLTLPWMLAQPFLRVEAPVRRDDEPELAGTPAIQPRSAPPGSLPT